MLGSTCVVNWPVQLVWEISNSSSKFLLVELERLQAAFMIHHHLLTYVSSESLELAFRMN